MFRKHKGLAFGAFSLLFLVLAGLYIHFIYLPDGYYFWEELPPVNECSDAVKASNTKVGFNYSSRVPTYSAACDGVDGWINYFGSVSMRKEADKDSELVVYASYKNRIGTFGDEVNGYYYCKYYDPVSDKIFAGYISSDCISREEIITPQAYLYVPKYMQTDARWGDVKLGGYETIESAGCTTTCLAMAYSCMKKETIYPNDMAETLYYDYDGNLAFPDEFIRFRSNNFLSVIYDRLNAGIPVLVGCFRPSGFPHWCIVYAYTGEGEKFNKADFLIHDPYTDDRKNLEDFFKVFSVFNKIAYYNGDETNE